MAPPPWAAAPMLLLVLLGLRGKKRWRGNPTKRGKKNGEIFPRKRTFSYLSFLVAKASIEQSFLSSGFTFFFLLSRVCQTGREIHGPFSSSTFSLAPCPNGTALLFLLFSDEIRSSRRKKEGKGKVVCQKNRPWSRPNLLALEISCLFWKKSGNLLALRFNFGTASK